MIVSMPTPPKIIHLIEHRQHPEVRAFLDLIAHSEGTEGKKGYFRIYGINQYAKNLKDHPGRCICALSKGKKLCSTAAGRYQFLHTTWDELAGRFGFKDFGQFNQDLAAIAILDDHKVIEDLERHRIKEALAKSCHIWASLPGSPYGQPTHPLEEMLLLYDELYKNYKNGVLG